jgi:predicted RNA-binding protein with PIN domain
VTAQQRGDDPVALVDAWNVIRSRWPNIDEERFLDATRAWAEREGTRAVVVFDGPAPGTGGEMRELEATTVVGTGRASADDWIAEHARTLAEAGERVWLVSSDRGLRERVAPYAERVIGGGSFAAILEAGDRSSDRG